MRGERVAMEWRHTDGKVECTLCAHRCQLDTGKYGVCRVRRNVDGELHTLIYALASARNIDPIEKKPLYHFHPGTMSYSLGTVGCNFRCAHCQNYEISQATIEDAHLLEIPPEQAVSEALATGCASIAWTYNEPTIWFEYTYDTARLAHEHGLSTVYVTNGYITEEALTEISPYLDAFRVDIKGRERVYTKLCKAKLEPVLESAKLAFDLGMHVEVVNLIIPGYNDSQEDIEWLCRWVVNNLSSDVPVHFTRFFPYYRLNDVEPTPVETLERAYETARAMGVHYPYVGNVMGHRYEHTYCPACGTLLIERKGFYADLKLDKPVCPRCGASVPIVGLEGSA
ncbi:MAG: AmmeMemoRadiSam system radical SAM enzyme [Methermicoccaceae archaeon]